MLGVNPLACVVFEDAIAGVEAAKNGGMQVVGIGSIETLAGADLIIDSLQEMNISLLNEL